MLRLVLANNVNPYTQKVPINTPIHDSNGQMNREWVDWFNYDNLWKQQMWVRSGGGEDFTEDLQDEVESLGSSIASVLGQINLIKEAVRDIEHSDNINSIYAIIDNKLRPIVQQVEDIDLSILTAKLNKIDGRLKDIEEQL